MSDEMPAVFRNARHEVRMRRLESQVVQLANAIAGLSQAQLAHAQLLNRICHAPDDLPEVARGFGLGH